MMNQAAPIVILAGAKDVKRPAQIRVAGQHFQGKGCAFATIQLFAEATSGRNPRSGPTRVISRRITGAAVWLAVISPEEAAVREGLKMSTSDT